MLGMIIIQAINERSFRGLPRNLFLTASDIEKIPHSEDFIRNDILDETKTIPEMFCERNEEISLSFRGVTVWELELHAVECQLWKLVSVFSFSPLFTDDVS